MSSKLRIIPLGGCGEIGKNMTAIEYDDHIIVIDAGIMFPENDMLGVDTIIPDYTYLKDNKDKVRALLLTHGHEDHVGAISYFLDDIHVPVYGTPLTLGLAEVKLRRGRGGERHQLRQIQAGDAFTVGPFMVEPFHVTHSIPDCVGFGITSPVGLVVFTGDYKFDHTPEDGWPPDFAKLAEFSARGVLCMLADSTNSERPGWMRSEKTVSSAFDQVFANAPGRIIVATFASHISRIQQVADVARRYGRKLAITGRSMRDNTKMAQELGYLDLPDEMVIDVDHVGQWPPNEVAIVVTGTQGEPTSVLGRLARGRHRNLEIEPGDTVVLSAHIIPGNEEMTHRIINGLIQRKAEVLYEGVADVHVSGHASQEEMKLMINLVRPKFLIPVHGELRHLTYHAKMARQMGYPPNHVAVIENGTVVELDEDSLTIGERLPGGYVFLQGGSIVDAGISTIRDRERLAQAGFFVAAIRLNSEAELLGEPGIVSDGFVDISQEKELLQAVRETIARTAKLHGAGNRQLSGQIAGAIGRLLYAETGLRPQVYVIINN